MKIFSTSFITNLLLLLFLLPNNTTAQRLCEDPLSLEWLQFYLGDPCTNAIYAFEYNGNNYVYATINQSCIASDGSNTLYNCDDESFCQVFGFTLPEDQCDADLVAAIEPLLTDENLIYPLLPVRGCENPLSLNWVQEALELPCTDGIYAFEHEGTPYIYRSTACEYLDDPNRLYNCNDKTYCFVQGFTLPQDQCDTSNLSLSTYLVDRNLIWSSPLLKLMPEYDWLKTAINLKNCKNTTVKEFITSNNTKYVSVKHAGKEELFGENGSVLCTTRPNFNCESIYGLTSPNSEWSCDLKPIICGLDEPQNSLPWLQQLIDETTCDCNTSIIQYCYKDAVYFDSTPLSPGYCADYAGFIYDEFGTVICQNGGITGGDCFRTISDFYSAADLIGTVWSCNENCGCQNFNTPICGEDGNIYESNCAATCAGIREIPCDDDNGGDCETLGFSNLSSDCSCCNDIIVFEITGGDGNYEVTTLDGKAITNGMQTGSLPIGANELIVTDGQGCQATGIFNNYPFCCEVPPVCYGLDVTYDCDNGLQMGGQADCNSISIVDENDNIYYEGDFLQNGSYTFIEANPGQVSPPCTENIVTVNCGEVSNCDLPPDVGPCEAYLPRFYYNAEAGECLQFIYGGCEGNANNYETYDICVNSCGYTYQCTEIQNPLELPWLAEIIRNANGCFVNEVSQFTYNENIYFKTSPNWGSFICPTDLPVNFYNCDGLKICSQGFTPYPTCNEAMVLASNETGDVIWAYTESCDFEYSGIVKDYTGLDGCSFVIELNNGTVLEPTEVPTGFSLYDGQAVELSYKDEQLASICQVGITAKIICIQEVAINDCEIGSVEITSNPDLCGFGIVSLTTNDVFGNDGTDGEIAYVKVNADDSFEVLEESIVFDGGACYYAIAYKPFCDVPDFSASNFEKILNFEGNYKVSTCFEINLIQAPEYSISTQPYCSGEGLFTVGVTVSGGSGEYLFGVDYTGNQVFGTTGETLVTFSSGQRFYDIYPTDAVTGCSNDYIIPLEDPGCSIIKNCDNPLELEIVQNAIANETCTGGVYAFDFDDQSYIYIQTLCEFIDAGNVLYNCNTGESCTIGGESIFVEACYELYDRLSDLINEENLIWTKPCEYEYAGTVKSYDCGLVIESPDDNILEPEIIPDGFTLEEGQNVEYSFRRIPIGATCNFAEKAEIICIRLIEEGCACDADFTPVCGVDGNTYSNACVADCEGVEVAYEGACEEACICTAEYDPVCGVDGNTYSNACAADCEGVEVAYNGECQEACICTEEYDPVCGVDGNTYGNACMAECENVAIAFNGECGLNNNAAMFDRYSWLNNMISPEACASGTKVSEYPLGAYNFIYIEWPSGDSSLYLEDGTYYCSDAPGYSCLALYGFTESTDSYTCLSDNANDNIVVTASEIKCNPDGTFLVKISATGALSGTYGMYHSYGDGAPNFINFGEGETISFEGNAADAENDMFTVYIYDEFLADVSAKAVKINVTTCLQQSNQALYNDYNWLSDVMNENDCLLGSSVTEYNFGHYSFVYVKRQNTGSLYFEDGTFYCSDAPGYSCLSIYGFNNPTSAWNCDKVVECDATLNPVCGTDGNTYNNECEALYAGTTVAAYQACAEPTMFDNYNWLNEIVNIANCDGNSIISEFDFGHYSFVYVSADNVGTLYFEDGTYYCSDAPGYSCLGIYGFTSPTKEWNCDGQLTRTQKENSIKNYLKFTSDFKLYPNPSYGQFKVEISNLAETQATVNVMDIQGKVLKTKQLDKNEYIAEFDLSNMAKGIYMVHLQTDNHTKMQKLIIR